MYLPDRLRNRYRRGFSTPELLMTIVVFSFGLLPLIVLFQRSHKVTAQAKNLMVAQSLGRTMIDEIRAFGFEGIRKNYTNLVHSWKQVVGPVVPPDPAGGVTETNPIKFPDYYGRFETQVAISPYPSDVSPFSKTDKFMVALKIRWLEPGRQGGMFDLAFGTVVVRYGAK